MKAKLYTVKGEVKQEVALPEVFDSKISASLLKQAVRVYEDRTHFGLARVKTRSEVNMTKKKLYKQKGTGGARHGAKSAHIFVGGGVAHGPEGEKRNLNLPIKMKKAALVLAMSNKFKSGKAVLVQDFDKVNKTNEIAKVIETIKKSIGVTAKVTVVVADNNLKALRFMKNIADLKVFKFTALNALNVLTSNAMIFDSNCFEVKDAKKEVKKSVKKVK